MRSHKLSIVPLIAGWFLLAALAPAEAGFLSWSSGNGWNRPTENGKGNIVINGGGPTITGSWSQIDFGSVYEVTIQTQSQNGKCENKVKIGLQGSKLEKTFETKCSRSGMRTVRNNNDLLLVGSPEEDFCVFTSNQNEVYYLQDGKWKKGDFNGDSAKDTELTPSEITAVKERITKWQAFFEKYDKEMQRIRDLKMAERKRFFGERATIWNEKQKQRQTHYANVRAIYRLRNEERRKHVLERNKIRRKRLMEGWSAAIEQLESAEDERHEKREAELEEMKDKEDEKFETTMNDFEVKVATEEAKSEEEIKKLESLEAEEEKQVLQELKENIKQGW